MNLNSIRALIIDIDGTLWRGDTPLPGLVEFFDFLNEHTIAFVVVTNNTVKTPARYRQKLLNFGAAVAPKNVLTATIASVAYLEQKFQPGASVYVIGENCLRQTLQQAGFTIVDNARRPVDVVVVAGDSGLTYNKLKDAILHIQRGVCFVGTNPDLLIPTEEGLVPEAGTTLAAIKAATGVSPTIIGKPERLLFDMAMKKMGSRPSQTAVIGDRLETDILGGQQAGLKTILVSTGVDDRSSIPIKKIKPDVVFNDLRELVAAWQRQKNLEK